MSDQKKDTSASDNSNARFPSPSPSRIPVTPRSQHLRQQTRPPPTSNAATSRDARSPGPDGQQTDVSSHQVDDTMAKKGKKDKNDKKSTDGGQRPSPSPSPAPSGSSAASGPSSTAAPDTVAPAAATPATTAATTAADSKADSSEIKPTAVSGVKPGVPGKATAGSTRTDYEARIKNITDEHRKESESWYEDIRKNQEEASKYRDDAKAKEQEIGRLRAKLQGLETAVHEPETGLNHQVGDLHRTVDKLTKELEAEKKRAVDATGRSHLVEGRLNSLVSDVQDKNAELDRVKEQRDQLQAINDELHTDLDQADQLRAELEAQRDARHGADRQLQDINAQFEDIFKELGPGLSSEDYLKHLREQQFGRLRRDESRTSMDELAPANIQVSKGKKKGKSRLASTASLQDEMEGAGDSSGEDEGDENDEDKTIGSRGFHPSRFLSEIKNWTAIPQPLPEDAQGDDAGTSESPAAPAVDVDPDHLTGKLADAVALSTQQAGQLASTASTASKPTKKPISELDVDLNAITGASTEPAPPPTTQPLPQSQAKPALPPQSNIWTATNTEPASPMSRPRRPSEMSVTDVWAVSSPSTKLALLAFVAMFVAVYVWALSERDKWLVPNCLLRRHLAGYEPGRGVHGTLALGVERWLGVDTHRFG